jgi:two-component system response regulator HydG
VLENGEVFRIGSNTPIKVNVRLISATNRDLEAAVEEGKFRKDLYYRLKIVTVKLPPLRERREDLPLLTAHFLKEFNGRHGKNVQRVSDAVRKATAAYDWPGNVRELRNVVESTVVQDSDGVLDMDDIQEGESLRRVQGSDSPAEGPAGLTGRPLTEVERYYCERALELTQGKREEAARLLGIGERTLYRMMQDWKVQDQIRQVLGETGGNVEEAAKRLDMKPEALERKLKKLGVREEE